jgi:hypothetical protein
MVAVPGPGPGAGRGLQLQIESLKSGKIITRLQAASDRDDHDSESCDAYATSAHPGWRGGRTQALHESRPEALLTVLQTSIWNPDTLSFWNIP